MKVGFRQRRPLPFHVMWYESAGWYTVLRSKSFEDPFTRDRFARKLPRKPGFIRFA